METLSEQIKNQTLEELAESLSPTIHDKEEGGASAILFKFTQPKQADDLETLEQPSLEETAPEIKPTGKKIFQNLKLPSFVQGLNHKRKIFLTIAIVIFIVLAFSIFSAIKKQADAKKAALFAGIYPVAEKKYEEGQSLLDLNKSLARDSFSQAQKILNDGKSKFSKNSKEEKQIVDLLSKVEKGLAKVSTVEAGLDRSKLSVTVQNGSGTEGVAGKAAGILKELGYNVASTGNADNYNYTGVAIKVKKEKGSFLELLKKDLSKTYTISSSSSDLSKDAASDALVIVGK